MAELPLTREDDGLVKGAIYPQEALHYKKFPNQTVRCSLCYQECEILPDNTGFCRTRFNKDGILHTNAFSNPCAVYIEPIEKEPMYHFLPGSTTLSIAVAGCNLRCKFCQNWLITQFSPSESMNYIRRPEDIIELAGANACQAIDFTYSEPTIFYEYMIEIIKLARPLGIKNICHSNGLMSEEPLNNLCKFLDAICIDLKGFEESFYKDFCSGSLRPVLRNLKVIKEKNIHLEIVNLIIPNTNDKLDSIERMCQWILENLGPDIPLHFLEFHPRYRLDNLDSTPLKNLETARDIAVSAGLNYCYISNIPYHDAKSTYCPKCKKLLIEREINEVIKNEVVSGSCKYCNFKIKGVWEEAI